MAADDIYLERGTGSQWTKQGLEQMNPEEQHTLETFQKEFGVMAEWFKVLDRGETVKEFASVLIRRFDRFRDVPSDGIEDGDGGGDGDGDGLDESLARGSQEEESEEATESDLKQVILESVREKARECEMDDERGCVSIIVWDRDDIPAY